MTQRIFCLDQEVSQTLFLYIEVIQRRFKCCGATGILDWFGLSNSLGLSSETNLTDPWEPLLPFVPASCIHPRRTPIVSPEMLSNLQSELKGLSLGAINDHAPIFQQGCVDAMGSLLEAETFAFIKSVFLTDVALNACLLVLCLRARWRTGERIRLNHYERNTGKYISNAKLLLAIQGTPLLARPSKIQGAYGSLRSDWLERGVDLGWCLGHKQKQNCEYLRRIYTRKLGRPGQIKTSTFRRILRTYLPLLEAVLYTDGDSRLEVEANDYYGGLIATLARLMFCALYGYLGAQVLIWAFITNYRSTSEEGDIQNNPVDSAQRDKIVNDLAIVTSYLVKVTFVIAAVISKRFRCFLALLGPTLGLSAGQSFLAAELTNIAVTGPVRGLATNLRSAGISMTCLMKLSQNITEDANKLLKPGSKHPAEETGLTPDGTGSADDEEEEDENDADAENDASDSTPENITAPVKYPKLKSLTEFNTYFTKVMKKASKGINEGAIRFKNLTDQVQKEVGSFHD